MFNNGYDGVLEPWKVRLISRRARRMGIRGPDLDDAQQQVVLALLDFKFDIAKSNGANEATALTAVIDRQLALIRRGESRARRRIEMAKDACEECYEATETTLVIDMKCAVQSLPDLDQRICRELALDSSINQLAHTLGIGWHAVRARMELIRQYFQRLGLSECLVPNKEADES